MAKNDFKSFATAANANVTTQANWEALPALLSGFTAGKASSAQVNKALRQATFIAAALAQYTANKSGQDVLDDGDVAGFIAKMAVAFGKDYQALDATLTALAGLATGANKLPYFTGNKTAGQTDLTQVGRDIIGKSSIDAVLQYLGLGKAAKSDIVQSTGSSTTSIMSQDVTTRGLLTKVNKADLPNLPILGTGSIRSGVTAGRELGITYVNDKQYSIFVTVMLQSTSRDSNLITRMRINDTPVSNFYVGTRGSDADILAEATHSQLVLPRERYVITSSPNSRIVSWVEITR